MIGHSTLSFSALERLYTRLLLIDSHAKRRNWVKAHANMLIDDRSGTRIIVQMRGVYGCDGSFVWS